MSQRKETIYQEAKKAKKFLQMSLSCAFTKSKKQAKNRKKYFCFSPFPLLLWKVSRMLSIASFYSSMQKADTIYAHCSVFSYQETTHNNKAGQKTTTM